jgi:formate-dependent nitrite reductase membrane component NrfD
VSVYESPRHEPPARAAEREERWVSEERDATPALGTRGAPGRWRRAASDAAVALARRRFADMPWSFIYGSDTRYASRARAREPERQPPAPSPDDVHGPLMKPPVWTWEVPLYFWFGGVAAGSSFVALACDLAGDHRSAAMCRKVSLAALLPSPPLLVSDLGRPARFANMLRVFKPRSPMNMGAWCLTLFGALGSGAVAADTLKQRKLARALGGANAVVGGYLGSYTGVLLAVTAVPLWARSRMFLGPIFVSTATATGAAACRLVLVASGLPSGHRTRTALGTVETGAMATELVLSTINERRLGRLGEALEQGRAGHLFRAAKLGVRTGLALRLLRGRAGVAVHHVASALYLASGLAFRYAWVEAGKVSAADDEAVARMSRHEELG